jgi:hypothetical protein
MAGNDSSYAVFVADKFIGRSKPMIVVCYNTSNPHHWTGRWFVITADELQCTQSADFNLGPSEEYELKSFMTPEQLVDQVASTAEGLFWQAFEAKHPTLWTRFFESNYPPRFLRLDEADGKNAIFRMLFASQQTARDAIREFGSRCGDKDLAKSIEVVSQFKVSFGMQP